MGKVRLKFPTSIASMLKAQGSDQFIFEKEIEEGATIGDLLTSLALSEPDFRKVVFNPDIGKISDQVNVILNNNLLQLSDVTEVKLKDGDSLFLIPMYSGG